MRYQGPRFSALWVNNDGPLCMTHYTEALKRFLPGHPVISVRTLEPDQRACCRCKRGNGYHSAKEIWERLSKRSRAGRS